jgi:aspartate aminotransferase/aminotransferase
MSIKKNNLSKRTEKMSVSGIRRVFELSQGMENPIDLSIGKPDFSIPKNIKERAKLAIDENQNTYSLTVGIPELRQAVVEKLRTKNNIKAQENEVIITSAVSGGMSVALPTLIDAGDEVIIFDPYFVAYKQLVLLFNGVPIIVPKNDDFSPNFQTLEEAISSKTKAIILNTPENPTGYVWTKSELEKLTELAQKYNLTIIADEIYEDFIYSDDRPHISIASIYDKVITVNGFSKSHSMTGWRVGYLHAPVEIIAQIIKVQQYTFVCAPTPFQYAALETFSTDISNFVIDYRERRDILFSGLSKKYEIQPSLGAFYFFVKYPYSAEKFLKNCLAKNLLIVPGNVFSEKNDYFRISFATSMENIQRAVKVFQEIV